jgi:mersacidin/lichenicidin family type 2 lantibiotic
VGATGPHSATAQNLAVQLSRPAKAELMKRRENDMKTSQIVRAWKDNNYRQKLSKAEQAELPAHPSGMIELSETELGMVSGGASTAKCHTYPAHCTITGPGNCPHTLACFHE